MATTKKFQITAIRSDSTTYTITINNPKPGITVAEVQNFLEGYGSAYVDEPILKTAKYIDTSDTFVYPVS